MESRNPLKIFGKKSESLYVEGASIIHTAKNGRITTIPISSIQQVILHPPNGSFYGGIVLTTARWMESATNVQLLNLDELPYAQNIQKYIAEFQANASTAQPATPPISVADELIKLKSLLDDGVLTQEEFDKKKSKLLDS